MSETTGWKPSESMKQMWCPTCKKAVAAADKICTECLCFDCHSLGDKAKRAAHRHAEHTP